MCGPLLSFVFAVQTASFIQYCTDPRTFEVDVNKTHFVGFSSSGIDNSSFVFFFDGVDRSKELVLCSTRGDPAKNDPTGLSLPLRAGIAGAAKCGNGGLGCDRYGGYIGSTRYYDQAITAAQMKDVYNAESMAHLSPPPAAATAVAPTAAAPTTTQRVDGGAGLIAEVVAHTNAVNVTVDGTAWLLAAGGAGSATWFGAQPHGTGASPLPGGGLALRWAGSAAPFQTEILPGPRPGSLIFRQTFTEAIPDTAALWNPPPAPPPSGSCGTVTEGSDQSGGHECCGTPVDVKPNGFRGYSPAQCCAACIANT